MAHEKDLEGMNDLLTRLEIQTEKDQGLDSRYEYLPRDGCYDLLDRLTGQILCGGTHKPPVQATALHEMSLICPFVGFGASVSEPEPTSTTGLRLIEIKVSFPPPDEEDVAAKVKRLHALIDSQHSNKKPCRLTKEHVGRIVARRRPVDYGKYLDYSFVWRGYADDLFRLGLDEDGERFTLEKLSLAGLDPIGLDPEDDAKFFDEEWIVYDERKEELPGKNKAICDSFNEYLALMRS